MDLCLRTGPRSKYFQIFLGIKKALIEVFNLERCFILNPQLSRSADELIDVVQTGHIGYGLLDFLHDSRFQTIDASKIVYPKINSSHAVL